MARDAGRTRASRAERRELRHHPVARALGRRAELTRGFVGPGADVSWWQASVIAALAALALYALFVGALVAAGRGDSARAFARVIPDCIVLVRRLLADPRVPRGTKLLLGALIAYLALPFDVVPDFVPVAGYLDDAVLVAFVLRRLLRSSGPGLIEEHWPGSPASLALVLRFAGHRRQAAS